MISIHRWAAFFVTTALLCGCTFTPPKVGITVRWDTADHKFAAPSTVSDVSCFFVNVTGLGIQLNNGPDAYGGRTPDCLGLGIVAGPFPLSTLATGVRLLVPPGEVRTIEILGALSTEFGDSCLNRTLTDYFNTLSPPQLYTLGSTTTKLFVDSKITVENSYQQSSSKDRVASCPGTPSGGVNPGSQPDGTIAGVKAFAHVSLAPQLRTYNFTPSVQEFNASDAILGDIGAGTSLGIRISPDFTRLIIPFSNSGQTQLLQYSLSKSRVPTKFSNFTSASSGEGWVDAIIAPLADNFYPFSLNSFFQLLHVGDKTDEIGAPTTTTQLTSPVVTPNEVWVFTRNLARGINSLTRLTRGSKGVLNTITNVSSIIASDLTSVTLATDRLYSRLFITRDGVIEVYRIGSNGLLTLLDSEPISLGPTKLVVNRSGNRLYLLRLGPPTVATYFTVSEGGVLSASAGSTTVTHFGRLLLEPTGKVLFIDNTPANLTDIVLDEDLPNSIGMPHSYTQLEPGLPISMVNSIAFAPIFQAGN